VTSLRRCDECCLLFRAPTTTVEENATFYQSEYRQGFTTDLPDEHSLRHLLETNFVGSEKDYSVYINVLKALGCHPGDRILDFGCSWGYGSWQLRHSGFEVISYEISRPRCEFARAMLDVASYDSLEELGQKDFDVFFSAHVIEHVPSVSDVLAYAKKMLRKGGLFVAFTPNGSDDFRKAAPTAWNRLWNMVHPNFLDVVFYEKNLPGALLASSPYDFNEIETRWKNRSRFSVLPGSELLAACKMT
jgi:2-polyprenyl-3-methyl-5-hydroxy-6-metoxy-1,4-benzoquinol methylase